MFNKITSGNQIGTPRGNIELLTTKRAENPTDSIGSLLNGKGKILSNEELKELMKEAIMKKEPEFHRFDQDKVKENLKKLMAEHGIDGQKPKFVPTVEDNSEITNLGGTKLEDIIPLDSELGEKIAARKSFTEDRTFAARRILPPSEYDDYEPVYRVVQDNIRGESRTVIGYRPKTEFEKSGHVNY
ncbi:hypothetical protein IJZ97_00410 [bacterium]|nr:hypothetical protein [bacterium]